jgi:hypothetical protein
MSPAESFEACPSPAARGRGAGGLEGVDPPGDRADATQSNQVWVMDFVRDQLATGRMRLTSDGAHAIRLYFRFPLSFAHGRGHAGGPWYHRHHQTIRT